MDSRQEKVNTFLLDVHSAFEQDNQALRIGSGVGGGGSAAAGASGGSSSSSSSSSSLSSSSSTAAGDRRMAFRRWIQILVPTAGASITSYYTKDDTKPLWELKRGKDTPDRIHMEVPMLGSDFGGMMRDFRSGKMVGGKMVCNKEEYVRLFTELTSGGSAASAHAAGSTTAVSSSSSAAATAMMVGGMGEMGGTGWSIGGAGVGGVGGMGGNEEMGGGIGRCSSVGTRDGSMPMPVTHGGGGVGHPDLRDSSMSGFGISFDIPGEHALPGSSASEQLGSLQHALQLSDTKNRQLEGRNRDLTLRVLELEARIQELEDGVSGGDIGKGGSNKRTRSEGESGGGDGGEGGGSGLDAFASSSYGGSMYHYGGSEGAREDSTGRSISEAVMADAAQANAADSPSAYVGPEARVRGPGGACLLRQVSATGDGRSFSYFMKSQDMDSKAESMMGEEDEGGEGDDGAAQGGSSSSSPKRRRGAPGGSKG